MGKVECWRRERNAGCGALDGPQRASRRWRRPAVFGARGRRARGATWRGIVGRKIGGPRRRRGAGSESVRSARENSDRKTDVLRAEAVNLGGGCSSGEVQSDRCWAALVLHPPQERPEHTKSSVSLRHLCQRSRTHLALLIGFCAGVYSCRSASRSAATVPPAS